MKRQVTPRRHLVPPVPLIAPRAENMAGIVLLKFEGLQIENSLPSSCVDSVLDGIHGPSRDISFVHCY